MTRPSLLRGVLLGFRAPDDLRRRFEMPRRCRRLHRQQRKQCGEYVLCCCASHWSECRTNASERPRTGRLNLVERYDKQKSRELRGRIRIVLMEEWDPIGVKDIPEAADECDTYIGSIHGLLVRKAPITEISEYLNWVEVGQMGLGRSTEAARVVLDTVAAS